jgi:cytoskeletal protein CcmA (bactofilin family)
MGMFSSSPPPSNANGSGKDRRRAEQHGLSIVAPDLVVTGDLESGGVVKVEGRVTGMVRAGQQVLVAQGAVIDGDLNTRDAVVGGTVHGSIHATDRVEVQPHAVVEGDITTRNLLIQEGGRVNGVVTMRTETAAEADALPIHGARQAS